MKKKFSLAEAITLTISSATTILFFVPILGDFPLIENNFFFYGTMLPFIAFLILIYFYMEEKKYLVYLLLAVGGVIGVLTLLGIDFRDLYFLVLSLVSLVINIFVFYETSPEEKKPEVVKTITRSQSKIKH
jgi:hypothetical protein